MRRLKERKLVFFVCHAGSACAWGTQFKQVLCDGIWVDFDAVFNTFFTIYCSFRCATYFSFSSLDGATFFAKLQSKIAKSPNSADSKFSNRHVTFESNSNRDVRLEFESNIEASQVPKPSRVISYWLRGTYVVFYAIRSVLIFQQTFSLLWLCSFHQLVITCNISRPHIWQEKPCKDCRTILKDILGTVSFQSNKKVSHRKQIARQHTRSTA